MKLVKINKIPAYYIGKIGKDILISVENIHPFEYPNELYKSVIRLSQKIPLNEINVYLNLSKTYGYLKIDVIKFSKEDNNFDFSSNQEISFKGLPDRIRSKIKETTFNFQLIQ